MGQFSWTPAQRPEPDPWEPTHTPRHRVGKAPQKLLRRHKNHCPAAGVLPSPMLPARLSLERLLLACAGWGPSSVELATKSHKLSSAVEEKVDHL